MPDENRTETIPPPTMGLSTKQPISQMNPLYAREAENWFSNGQTVDTVKGYRTHATGIGVGEVIPSLAALPLQNGTTPLICATYSGGIPYGIIGGVVSNLSGGAGLFGDGDFSSVVFRNRLFMKDYKQTNDVFVWDGTTANLTGPGFGGPAVDDKALKCPTSYRSRLYFLGFDLSVWYGGVDQIAGLPLLQQFDMQSVFRRGGFLVSAGPLQRNEQIDQAYFYALSSEGEMLVYQGDYPGSTTWSLLGRYDLPTPIGLRPTFYWGSNLVIITVEGVVLASDVMAGGELIPLTEEVSSKFTEYLALASGFSPGDDIAVSGHWHPPDNQLIITFGRSLGGAQLVMSTINRSWWPRTARPAFQFATAGGELYFAGYDSSGLSTVFKGNSGYYDVDGTDTARARNAVLRTAPSQFETRKRKIFVSATPIMNQSEGLNLKMDMDCDFADTTPTNEISDLTDTAYKLYSPEVGLTGMGRWGNLHLEQTVTARRISLQAIDVTFKEAEVR